jgi:ribosome maturation factor RimP
MIEKNRIIFLAEEAIADSNIFLVDVTVSASNKIVVLIDCEGGLSIADCIRVSRFIESSLDREVEDFDMDVSSPGIGEAFKVIGQYKKAIGRNVEVITSDDKIFCGTLLSVTPTDFSLEVEEKVKLEGQKKKQLVKNTYTFAYDSVRTVCEKFKF